MAKAAASKFSVLRIEDDSDDEFAEVMRGTPSAKTQAPKKKAKKRTKKPVQKTEATEEEWAKMDAKLTKLQYEEEVRKALEASKETFAEEKMLRSALNDENAEFITKTDKKKKRTITHTEIQSGGAFSRSPPSSSRGFSNSNDEAHRIVEEEKLREEVAKRSKDFDKTHANHEETMEQESFAKTSAAMKKLMLERDTFKTEAEKYKERYKKLCVLLKDAEVKEKAQLLVDVEKGKSLRDELAEEITELNGQLEQARSRIHELEALLPKKP